MAKITSSVQEENKDGTYTAVKKNITVGDEINYYTEVTGGDLKAEITLSWITLYPKEILSREKEEVM